MNTLLRTQHRIVAMLIGALFAAAPVWADSGNHHGDKGAKHAQKHAEKHAEKAEKHAAKQGRHEREREEVRIGGYFNDHHRDAARAYYSERYAHAKHCPPGLAKKHNGCMPPGQAKKWAVGHPVPPGVVVYSVPQPVLVQLPPAPYGYRYARIGNDIVLVQAHNNVIVDVISGLLG